MEAERACTVIVESGSNNYSAYVPDLPGCITTGIITNMGIMIGSMAANATDCASAASLHAEPNAACSAPTMKTAATT